MPKVQGKAEGKAISRRSEGAALQARRAGAGRVSPRVGSNARVALSVCHRTLASPGEAVERTCAADAAIPEHKIEEILERVDLVALVSRHVELKKAGPQLQGPLPVPSGEDALLLRHPEMRRFKCFGCQAGGDAISFVQRYLGKTFVDAVRDLAREAGVDLEAAEDPAARERQQLQGGHRPRRRALPSAAVGPGEGQAGARRTSQPRRHRGDRPRPSAWAGRRCAWSELADRLTQQACWSGALKAGLVAAAHPRRGLLRHVPRPADHPHPLSRGPHHRLRRPAARGRRRAQVPELARVQASTTRARRSTGWTWPARRSAGGRPPCWSRATSTASALHQVGVKHAVALCSTALTPGH